jgi:hypothetical protein
MGEPSRAGQMDDREQLSLSPARRAAELSHIDTWSGANEAKAAPHAGVGNCMHAGLTVRWTHLGGDVGKRLPEASVVRLRSHCDQGKCFDQRRAATHEPGRLYLFSLCARSASHQSRRPLGARGRTYRTRRRGADPSSGGGCLGRVLGAGSVAAKANTVALSN